MIVLRLLRFLRGYVRFEARGAFAERFLNLAARHGIPMWGGSKRGEVYSGCVVASDYKKLRAYAKKTGVRLRVTGKSGAPFQRRRFRGRAGMLIGLGFFVLFIFGMSRFVWRVEVRGNHAVGETGILRALESLGVAPGVLRSGIDVRECERKILILLPELSWAALNIEGSAVRVEVSEATPPPELVHPNEPCNVVAGQAGQILSMNVFSGQTLIKAGDTVLPGQVIVSGITQDRHGQSLFRHARAEVIAQVRQETVVEVPLNQTEYIETGKITRRRYFGIFGIELPLFLPFKLESPYHVQREENRARIFSAELPIRWLKEDYIHMREVPIVLTEEQAKGKAIKELLLLERATYDDAEIIDRQLTAQLADDIYRLRAVYTCNMDIALERKINRESPLS